MKKALSLIFVCLFFCVQCSQKVIPSQTADELDVIHVILLSGQSNMAGQGNYDELSDVDKERLQKVQDRVSLSTEGKPAQPLSARTRKKTEKYNFTQVFGPELFVGITLAEKYPKRKYLLIKTSQGGTSLYGAWSTEWTAEKAKAVEKGEKKQTTPFYQLHQTHIKTNLDRLKAEGKKYKIVGWAWMQGENDAAREVTALSYEENFKKLIAAYRRDTNEPQLPLAFGQINSSYGKFKAGPETVRSAMKKVADADPLVTMIPTTMERTWTDFPKHTDNVHYNAEGQKRLGTAFGKALLKMK